MWRSAFNSLFWVAIVAGVCAAFYSPDQPQAVPAAHHEASAPGHPLDCAACRNRGRALPDEIGNDTVWVVSVPSPDDH